MTDPLYATRQARIENGLKLSEILGAIFETKPATHWANLFFAERVPAAIVHRVDEAVSQPVARLRNMAEEVEKPDTGVSTRFRAIRSNMTTARFSAIRRRTVRTAGTCCATFAATTTQPSTN